MCNTLWELDWETEKLDWWIEICTANPLCIYYFGGFDSSWEALLAKDGYIEDLKQEEAELNSIRIKWCKPRQLTIYGDELEVSDLKFFSATSAV